MIESGSLVAYLVSAQRKAKAGAVGNGTVAGGSRRFDLMIKSGIMFTARSAPKG